MFYPLYHFVYEMLQEYNQIHFHYRLHSSISYYKIMLFYYLDENYPLNDCIILFFSL